MEYLVREAFPKGRKLLISFAGLLRSPHHTASVDVGSTSLRIKVRELAAEKGWTFKEVSERSGVVYNTVKHYARCPGLTTVDFTLLRKLARTFDVMIEDLVEVLEE